MSEDLRIETMSEDLRIEREVVIEAPREVVWRTITEPDQVARWFADRVELDLRPGGRGTFVFGNDASAKRYHLVVETVEPPARFSFRWASRAEEDPVDGLSLLVEFTLSAEGAERTRLRVVETGLAQLGWSGEEMRRYADDHRRGWRTHLDRLASQVGGRAGDRRPG